MPFLYRGDSIAVFDQRLRRTTIFSTGSDDHRTIPNEMDGNFVVFGSTGGGQLLYFNLGGGYRPDLEPGLQWDTTDVYLASPDGSASVISRRASRQQVVLPDGNTDILIPAHGSIQGATNAGFFWGTTERYEVRLYDLGGTLRRIVRRPVEPTDVDESMVDAYIEYQLDRVRRYEGEEAVPRYRERYENGTYNEKVPIFGRAFLDREGRLWISQSTWPELRASPRSWSVFSPEGRWLGDVESLQGLLLLDSVGDRVLGIWSDEFDVPHVRVHRIVN